MFHIFSDSIGDIGSYQVQITAEVSSGETTIQMTRDIDIVIGMSCENTELDQFTIDQMEIYLKD